VVTAANDDRGSGATMPDFDVDQIDHLLSTTRAVRKRLDLERPVPDEVLLRMIDLAEQAPSGGNDTSRRWIVVRDPGQKRKLAEIYREAGLETLQGLRDRTSGDSQNARNFNSALYLAENLERVPALVLSTIYGQHDGSGRPGLFDSVIQSAWSFCLAARARGIGTAWTTIHLERAEDVAKALDIPAGVSQVVLFPVAYVTNPTFKPAPRRPADEITYFDHWGLTFAPPAQAAHPGEGRGVSVEIDISASADQLWPIISDITTSSRCGSELQSAEWKPGHEPGLGSSFHGTNSGTDLGHPIIDAKVVELTGGVTWTTECHVVEWEPGRVFSYTVGDPDQPAARWTFRLYPMMNGTTRVTHSMRMLSGMSGTSLVTQEKPEQAEEVLTGRLLKVRENIQRTLAGIKDTAQGH
jgi:nitroreductase